MDSDRAQGPSTLDDRLDALDAEFELAGDWNDRYRLLVEWGEALEALPEDERTPQWEVTGCSSPLWLKVTMEPGRLSVSGASPGILPKALLALVVHTFDGLTTLTGTPAQVLERWGVARHLSPTRMLVLERLVDRVYAVGGRR